MKKLFSTNDVHVRDRFDYWFSVASEKIVPHDLRPESKLNFTGEIEGDVIADLTCVAHENSAMSVYRGTRHIARQEHSHLFMCRQSRGTVISEQEGRETVLEPGDMMLLDPRRPFSARFSSDTRFLIVMLPRKDLEARVGTTETLISRALRPHVGVNGLMSCFLEALTSQTDRFDPAAAEIVRNQFLELAALSLSRDAGTTPRSSSAKVLALFRIRAAIERCLADPSLNGQHVAASAGISVRYANKLLAERNSSLSRLIQRVRLERCRKTLKDPLHSHRSISEIAYAWGFSDMTHFGRSFRKLYGMPPSDYRQMQSRRQALPDDGDELLDLIAQDS
jgi:AraC-like DNA-binding protein